MNAQMVRPNLATLNDGTPWGGYDLAKLRMARLVRTRREGTSVFYRLENDHVRQLVLDAVFNAEHAGPGVPGHHQQDRAVKPLPGSA